jgi:hypothetical protein
MTFKEQNLEYIIKLNMRYKEEKITRPEFTIQHKQIKIMFKKLLLRRIKIIYRNMNKDFIFIIEYSEWLLILCFLKCPT